MDSKTSKFLTKSIWVALVLFALRFYISRPENIYGLIGSGSEIISITLILMGAYCCFLWRYNPFEKIPKLYGKYRGKIEYSYSGTDGEKETMVEIKQTLLNVRVRIITNEITSSTVAGSIIEENGEFILYYTYITAPKGKYSDKNPMQYGTCRLQLAEKEKLVGTYWTSRQTLGDITLEKVK